MPTVYFSPFSPAGAASVTCTLFSRSLCLSAWTWPRSRSVSIVDQSRF